MDETAKPQSESSSDVDEEAIPLLFNVPVGLSSRYAHHLLVQSTQNEVTVSFFEIIPPVLVGSPDQQKEVLRKGVRADCVSRITIARARYPEFVKAMMGQLAAEEKKAICE